MQSIKPGISRFPDVQLHICGLVLTHHPGMTVRKIEFSESRARRAADIDHVAVTDRGVLVREACDQHASVERDDLAILLAAGRSRRADVILAARTALETQFLRRRLVGQM